MQDLAEDNVACRICMDNKDNCVSLFSQDLSKKIMEIAAVQVEKDDGLPDSICTECENDLEKCYEFRLKVQVADKKFRENIKFSQVDIAECNIKQERYHIDDGNFDNADENDSVSMDDEHYNEELDVEQQPRSTGEVEPDPLNHVVVVEEKERKIEMAEYTLGQDDVMSEEPQLKTVEEPAVDPLVCMKEETDAEVMDVDSNQPDPFGPSVSVRSVKLLHSLPIAFSSSPRDTKAQQRHSYERIPLLTSSSHRASASIQFHQDRNQDQNLRSICQTTFHPNSRSLFTNVNDTHNTCAFPYSNMTSQGVNPGLFEGENGYFTTAMRNAPNADAASSNLMHNQRSTVPTVTEDTVHDLCAVTLTVLGKREKKPKPKKTKPSCGVDSKIKAKVTQSSSYTPDTILGKGEQPQDTFFCQVCNVDFGTADLLDEHKSGEKFICRACTVVFKNHQELEAHFFGHDKLICGVCTEVFYVKQDLTKHKNSVSACKKSTIFKCKICQNKFKHIGNFLIHVESKHPKNSPDSQAWKCQVCNKSVGTPSLLRYHMTNVHSVYESMECDICHSILLGPDRLKAHIKGQHLQPSSTEVCPICKKEFSSQSLKKHVESHIGEEKGCNICGAVIKGEINFKGHLRRHNEKLFSCKSCNVLFNTRAEKSKHYVQKHQRVPEPVICEICGKEYKSMAILKNHMMIHSDTKPYICEVCGSAFKQKVALRTHSRIHSDLGRFCCDQCGKDFRWKQTFDKHVLKCKPTKVNQQ